MIARMWHGYTTHENADAYENLLKSEIFQEIENKNVDGYRGIQLLRRTLLAYSRIRWLMLLSMLVRRWYLLMDAKAVRQAESFMHRTWF